MLLQNTPTAPEAIVAAADPSLQRAASAPPSTFFTERPTTGDSLRDAAQRAATTPLIAPAQSKQPVESSLPVAIEEFRVIGHSFGLTGKSGMPSGLSIKYRDPESGKELVFPLLNGESSLRGHEGGIASVKLTGVRAKPDESTLPPGSLSFWPKDAVCSVEFGVYNSSKRFVYDGRIYLDSKGSPVGVGMHFSNTFSFRRLHDSNVVDPQELINGPEVLGTRFAKILDAEASPQNLAELRSIIARPDFPNILEAAQAHGQVGAYLTKEPITHLAAFAIQLREKYPQLRTEDIASPASIALATQIHENTEKYFGRGKKPIENLLAVASPDTRFVGALAYEHMYAGTRESRNATLFETLNRLYGQAPNTGACPAYYAMINRP